MALELGKTYLVMESKQVDKFAANERKGLLQFLNLSAGKKIHNRGGKGGCDSKRHGGFSYCYRMYYGIVPSSTITN